MFYFFFLSCPNFVHISIHCTFVRLCFISTCSCKEPPLQHFSSHSSFKNIAVNERERGLGWSFFSVPWFDILFSFAQETNGYIKTPVKNGTPGRSGTQTPARCVTPIMGKPSTPGRKKWRELHVWGIGKTRSMLPSCRELCVTSTRRCHLVFYESRSCFRRCVIVLEPWWHSRHRAGVAWIPQRFFVLALDRGSPESQYDWTLKTPITDMCGTHLTKQASVDLQVVWQNVNCFHKWQYFAKNDECENGRWCNQELLGCSLLAKKI